MNEKVKVILIAGYTRSGSTLLDRVLGTLHDTASVGELCYIWENSFLQNHLCGCGEKFNECPFWKSVTVNLTKTLNNRNISDVIGLKQQVIRLKKIPNLLFPKIRYLSNQREYEEYSQIMLNLYSAIKQQSNQEFVVDSSKIAPHAYLLYSMAKQGLIDLFVIHLVRDSRAVSYSWQRRKKKPEVYWKEEYMPILSIWKSSAEWVLSNMLTSVIGQIMPHRYFFLRYEDFTSAPERELQKIRHFLGMDAVSSPISVGQSVELPLAHTISGNPMRFENGATLIKPDTEWVEKFSPAKKFLVTCLTFPLLLYYGYHL